MCFTLRDKMKYRFILSILMTFFLIACSQQKITTTSSSTPNQAIATGIAPKLTPTIILTLSPTSTTPPSTPVPLKGTIIFTSTSRIYDSISLLNLQDGNIRGVTGMGSGSISWSPDGEWIAFDGGIPPAQNQGIESQLIDLFIIKPNGSEYKRLTQSSQGKTDVNWSPDGNFLVYTYSNHVQPSDLAIFDLDRDVTYLLTNTNSYEDHPTWSPDGKQIAYLYSKDINQPNELWLMDADGNNPHRILEFELAFSRIDWSPDGQRIAFISAKNSQECGDVYIVRPDGTELTQLTNLSGCALNVVWSPDGKQLAFIERKDDFNNFKEWQSQVGIIDSSGQNHVTVIVEDTWRINDIDWKPIQ